MAYIECEMTTPAANIPGTPIQHVFVLMLENRAFDHMLGFSGLTGTDAETGVPTSIAGLTGNESNSFNGTSYPVMQPADWTMAVDPGHEFTDVLTQFCGPGTHYAPGGPYPVINNSGFVAAYTATAAAAGKQRDPGEILKCYSAAQLPVLNALAAEFAICDAWYASVPGPTWPNRLFVQGASSAGLDHSPTQAEIVRWETLDGFDLANGSIFDRLKVAGVSRRLYAGDDFPMVAALRGIRLDDIRPYRRFATDLGGAYPYAYTFIEPSYCLLDDYKCSTSQHPLDDITRGEALIKATYEAIRNSPLWPNSLLILTWDEHGGFYDHVAPPPTVAPGDTQPGSEHNKYGFAFDQLGGRVPAVVISPLIPRNLVDHRIYDHSSIPATLEALFNLQPMTARDAAANTVLPLLSLATPRLDAPTSLPEPAASGIGGCPPAIPGPFTDAAVPSATPPVAVRPDDSLNEGNLPIVLHAALRQDLELSPAAEQPIILARVAALKTRQDAADYLQSVKRKMAAAHAGPAQ